MTVWWRRLRGKIRWMIWCSAMEATIIWIVCWACCLFHGNLVSNYNVICRELTSTINTRSEMVPWINELTKKLAQVEKKTNSERNSESSKIKSHLCPSRCRLDTLPMSKGVLFSFCCWHIEHWRTCVTYLNLVILPRWPPVPHSSVVEHPTSALKIIGSTSICRSQSWLEHASSLTTLR